MGWQYEPVKKEEKTQLDYMIRLVFIKLYSYNYIKITQIQTSLRQLGDRIR